MALRRLDTKLELTKDLWKEPNLCDRFKAEDLTKLGEWCWQAKEQDELSRSKWLKRTEAAMDLAMQVQVEKNFPWPNCANVIFPLVTIAALQFSSRSYANLVQAPDVVQYRIVGPDPDQKLKEQSERIGTHMSWQVLEEDTSWEEQHDRLLINVAIVGCNFVKTYYSSKLRRITSELVMARDFILDYNAKSVNDCARKTQVITKYRNDIYELVMADVYRKGILDEDWFNSVPPPPPDDRAKQDNRQGKLPIAMPDEDTPFRCFEQHRLLDLDHDGYYEPYTVTFEGSSHKVLRLVARWERDEDVDRTDFPGQTKRIRCIKAAEYYDKYGFIPAPDGGIYDIGFGGLLGPINEAVNSGINQLLDAGTQASAGGGFLGRGVKMRGGVYTVAPGTWKRVDSSGDDLRKAMVPFPPISPSEVMFKMLGLLIEYTERIAGTQDQLVGVNPGQNTPAETSRNTMEQGLKVYKGIYKRIWRAMKGEFKTRHKQNGLYLQSKKSFGTKGSYVNQEDYKSNPELVIPSADPDIVSDGQAVTQAGMVRQSAHEVPGYDKDVVERNWLKALKVKSIETVYLGADKTGPLPNPKVQVEQMKAQVQAQKNEIEKMKVVGELLMARNKLQAEINNINAQTVKLLAETQTEKVKAKVDAFEAIVKAFEVHSNMLTDQITAMSGGKDGDKGGGMGGMEAAPGNTSPQQVPAGGASGANGTMGL